jgi:glycosyltransferase involved in cell wall biosynthesis
MGLGEAARGILAALESAGLSVDAIDYLRGNPSRCTDRRYAHRLAATGRYQTSLYIINADWLPTVKEDVHSQLPNERYAIGYWAWELSEFPRRWMTAFDLVDEIWVASEHVRGGVQRLTEKPVRVVPNPVSVDALDLPGRDFFDLPSDRFVYLTLFDVHSIVARKNPQGAIDAFKSAFDPQDRHVHLVVKVNNADEEALEMLRRNIADQPNVTILDRVLTRRETNGLLQSCDVLVSLHRAEGFGLTPAEAMSLGKPVIATNYSGNTDFMTASNSLLIPYRLVKIGVGQGPYDKDAIWAKPDLDAAAIAMRRISADHKLYETIGRAAWTSTRSQLAPAVVGRRFGDYLKRSSHKPAEGPRS